MNRVTTSLAAIIAEVLYRPPSPHPSVAPGREWSPELSYGKFSQTVEATCRNPHSEWGPLLLQTAACGPAGAVVTELPPYFLLRTRQQQRRGVQPASAQARPSAATAHGPGGRGAADSAPALRFCRASCAAGEPGAALAQPDRAVAETQPEAAVSARERQRA